MLTFLPDNLLEYTDKMSMAAGLEVRVPYLDHTIVELSFCIPYEHKLRNGVGKWILREAFADFLPSRIQKRKKKGFNAPLAAWMKRYLDRYFEAQMTKDTVTKDAIFNWAYINPLRTEHQSGANDNSYELFSLIMFNHSYHRYFA